MPTNTDSQFTARFAPLTSATFVANQSTLSAYTPSASPINTGMLSDIGRATIYGPDIQDSFWNRFMKSPLSRGNAAMTARFGEVTSYAYDPAANQSVLFGATNPAMTSNVAVKNLSRQVGVAVNDYVLQQYVQTPEMIGDAASAIMASTTACYMDDMWVAAKDYFSGSTRSAKSTQYVEMTNGIDDAGFGDELISNLWGFSQNKFGYKSTLYNASSQNTKSNSVAVCLKKSCEYPAFKKLLSETFNPEYLRIEIDGQIGYVDDFATPAGAPEGVGELLGIVVDTRAFEITPMPGTLTTEAFRNPSRKETAYFTTYEYAFQDNPFFNKAFIYAKGA